MVIRDIYVNGKNAVRRASWKTEAFKVNVALQHGYALGSFLFEVVIDVMTEEVRREPHCTMVFADDIVITI